MTAPNMSSEQSYEEGVCVSSGYRCEQWVCVRWKKSVFVGLMQIVLTAIYEGIEALTSKFVQKNMNLLRT